LLAACATPAQKPEQAAAARPQQTAETSGDKLICRSVEVTGSRMPQRECHTLAEWGRMHTEGLDQFGLEAKRSAPSKGGN